MRRIVIIMTITIVLNSCTIFNFNNHFELNKQIGVYQDSIIKVTLYQETLPLNEDDTLSFPIEIEVIKQNSIILIKKDFASYLWESSWFQNDTLSIFWPLGHYEQGITQNYWFKRINNKSRFFTKIQFFKKDKILMKKIKDNNIKSLNFLIQLDFISLFNIELKGIKIEDKKKDLYNIFTNELPLCKKIKMEFTLKYNFK